MKGHVVLRYVGMVMLLNAFFMLAAAAVSLFNDLDTGFYPLILSFILTAIMGGFPFIFVTKPEPITNKESYFIMVSAWAMACLTGMLPYILWGGEFDLVNAWYESVSGYTTTGCTILTDVEALPKGLLFWRSCTHMLGGAGIILFVLAVVPTMGKAKVALYNVELSSLAKENYRFRIRKTMRIIMVVYLILITAETLLLRLAGMDWFDSVNHSFSTIATGGFSTHSLSIAYYNNVWIEMIVTFFMIISGIHFGLLFATITTKRNNIFRSEVSRFYIFCIIGASAAITVNLWNTDTYSFTDSIRYGTFQLASVISTTGFATANSGVWPAMSVSVLIFFSMICACAGSTTGGIKSDRLLIMLKTFRTRMLQIQHPNAIVRTKLNGVTLDDSAVSSVFIFVPLYLLVCIISTWILSALGIDLMTSFSASVSCMGNVGVGFGLVSSLSNYSMLPVGAKMVLSLVMLMGRLEIFGFLQIFLMRSWK